MSTHICASAALTAGGAPRSTGARNCWLTASSAAAGHGVNQSVVVQAVSAGKRRQRCRKGSPTGLMASTQCRLARALARNAA